MAKMSKARVRQLNRVRRLRNSLAGRGYILPTDVWDLGSMSTQQLSKMTADWFYKRAQYQVSAQDYAAIFDTYMSESMGIMPGSVVSGKLGQQIERRRSHIKRDYTFTGRDWEIIREAQMRGASPKDQLGANQATNELNRAISARGIDVVEAHIRQMPSEFFKRLDELCAATYESLLTESMMSGEPITNILEQLARYVRELLNRW